VDNVATIEQVITQFHQLYLKFTDDFYTTDTTLIPTQNLKKLRIEDAYQSEYFMANLLPAYLTAITLNIGLNNPQLTTLQSAYDFQYRPKLIATILEKLVHNQNQGKYVAKILNDLFGARLILPQLFEDRESIDILLSNLQRRGIISRFYTRIDGHYWGIHCYFQDKNSHFPWELQLWDSDHKSMNYQEHIRHDRERTIPARR